MSFDGKRGPWALGAAGLVAAALLLPGLDRDGLWDPWELERAEAAWALVADDGADADAPDSAEADAEAPAARSGRATPPGLALRWSAASLEAFGQREWAGRLPNALAGWLLALVCGFLAARFVGWRAGAVATVAAAASPLVVLNARTVFGATPTMLAQALLGWSVAEILFPRPPGHAAVRLGALGAATWLAVVAHGGLVGAAPPLVAALLLLAVVARPDAATLRARGLELGALALVAAGVTARVAADVLADHAGFSPWLGGSPRGLEPPTFEVLLERVFHATSPWSAFGLLALGVLFAPPAPGAPPREEPRGLRPWIALWLAAAFVATTLFTARYGVTTWVAVAPVALAVALLLGDVARGRGAWPTGALVLGMFTFLIWRDYRLYPASPLAGLPLDGLEVPEGFNPKRAWAVFLGVFGGVAGLSVGVGPDPTARLDPRAPYRLVASQWRRGGGFRAWLALAGVTLAGALIFGLVATLGAGLPLTTMARRVGLGLLIGVSLLPVAVLAGQALVVGLRRVPGERWVPIALAGALVGAWVAHGFLPRLSEELSPRAVFEAYARHAGPDEPLGEFELGTRAAAYYVDGPVQSFDRGQALVRYLVEDGRRWAVLPPDKLAGVDRDFRKQVGRHLFVVETGTSYADLVSNQPVEGVENANPVAAAVLDEAPDVAFPVGARFGDDVELVGYDLTLPRDGYVGAGERFEITWYWKALGRVSGAYKIFVHIDGMGNRIHGDHEAVDDRYPVRLWEPGDVIVDRQRLRVPANYRPGPYVMWVGFYSGDRRLEVSQAENDGADRAKVGVLQVR